MAGQSAGLLAGRLTGLVCPGPPTNRNTRCHIPGRTFSQTLASGSSLYSCFETYSPLDDDQRCAYESLPTYYILISHIRRPCTQQPISARAQASAQSNTIACRMARQKGMVRGRPEHSESEHEDSQDVTVVAGPSDSHGLKRKANPKAKCTARAQQIQREKEQLAPA